MNYKLVIGYLYPDLMNVYGDRGNIIALEKRCSWRKIDVGIREISTGDKLKTDEIDLYFFGGGQDKEQSLVANDLQSKKDILLQDAENGAVFLAICGGYQLLGKYYRPKDGHDIPGIGLFDAWTIAGERRMIGNVVIEMTDFHLGGGWRDSSGVNSSTSQLVGFENHSGKTFLGSNCKPLGKVKVGNGNNGEDGYEGAVYKNAYGCYLHGSLLPKNPHFADHLIKLALKKRYGEVALTELDDSLEWQAHEAAIKHAWDKK